ncbi:hypothetical protein QYE76_015183 [Lolium multiflorum]|uniref:DUF8039 domain-containing protein n=1 Tax=Lolium multiflorum TaxID=4521 RepID=A0AAD8U3Y8_LOLMU|nr:hypothetical protein QYE76_015183 [Lolium multiflorum]
MDVMKKTVSVLVAERDAARAQHEDHPLDLGSQQRRSSVASTEAPSAGAPTIEITAPEPLVVEITAPEPPLYPVDDIKEMKACHLYYPIGNMSMKVAIGSALPPGALHHNNPIQDGYARVTVEDIVQGFEDLDIDIATPEGATRLGDVKRQFILWQKKFIKFPARRQQVHPPTVVVVAAVAVVVVVLHLHLLHEGRRRPPIHLRRVSSRRPLVRPGRVPEPSLKPLPTRPWESSAEEVAGAAADLEKWKASCKKKIEGEPKQALAFKRNQELAEKQEKKALEEAEKKLERGKEVAQLGEQSKQSIAPLIVQAAGPDAPDIIAAAAAHGLTVTSAREQAATLGITLRALLGLDEAPMKDVVFTYVKNGPLVEPAQEEDLPRQMKGSTGF